MEKKPNIEPFISLPSNAGHDKHTSVLSLDFCSSLSASFTFARILELLGIPTTPQITVALFNQHVQLVSSVHDADTSQLHQ